MTGSYAGSGAMEVEGFQLANEPYPEVLAKKIELVISDSKSDKVEATILPADAMSKNPDVIFTSVGYAPSAALIIKQARELGFTGPIFGSDTLDVPELYEIVGDNVDSVIFTTFYDAAQPATELTNQFLDAYRAKYGKEPSATNVMCFDAYFCLRAAIETAGSTDSAAIRDALFATNGFVGAAGTITLDESHNAVRLSCSSALTAMAPLSSLR